MKFKLGKRDTNKLIKLAKARHDAKHGSFRNAGRIKHTDDEKVGHFEDLANLDKQYMAHFLGLVGELAWSKYSGEPLDEEIYAVRDSGEDFKGIEVKTLTYNGPGEPELKITEKEYDARKKPKKYVLVKFDLKTKQVEILGTITRYMFDKHKQKKKYGRFLPTNYVVPVSKMRKLA